MKAFHCVGMPSAYIPIFCSSIRLIFAWVCYSCFGVRNQLKSSIRLVCLRPIFLYVFKSLVWNKVLLQCVCLPSAYISKFCFQIVCLWQIFTCFVFQYGFEQILFRCLTCIETLYCFCVPSAYILIMVFSNCHQEVFERWLLKIIHVLVCWINWSFPSRRCALGLYT